MTNSIGKENTKKALTSQTLLRGLDVVEAVADGPLSISDIAQKTGITYGTAHRIVSVLLQRHYLKPDGGKGYSLGRKVLELGFMAFHQTGLTRISHPFLEQLARDTLDTVHLARIEGDSVIYLDKISSQRSLEISSRIGGRKPLISTGVGKALMLDWTEKEWAELYHRDAPLLREETTLAQWLGLMRGYAQGGYTFDLGEDVHAIRCVAAPLRDGSRKIVAAISVSSTLEYMDAERMHALIPVVKGVAAQISAELGMRA
ncbi:IclR family transcriptional regulator [Rhodoferax sp.]|uniref:IclR family transcriptional regulator n=1 Tax=Rhodoferax sp. TaxID=50421 RepID=UPI0025E84129|nr:IclR family transcriptional regulator [Rhodoferax sp.]MCM2296169.1 IclR family transcriptional regulator [Rhodoferax sp.]